MTRLSSLVTVALLLSGCVDDFDPASLINTMRVLGARVSVVGQDPSLAWPRAGDQIEVRWLVAFPAEPRPLSSMFIACAAAPTSFGQQFCDGAPSLPEPCDEEAEGEPCARFTVPASFPSAELLILGGVCADGSPTLDPVERQFGCEGEGAEGTPVLFTVPLAPDDANNRHPAIATVTLRGGAWEAPPDSVFAPDAECVPGIPEIAPEASVELAVQATADSYENFSVEVDGALESRTEQLQVSHFSTAGELDRQFSFLSQDEDTRPMGWDSPTETGRLVRFYFVIRDQRGGVDWTVRAACVR